MKKVNQFKAFVVFALVIMLLGIIAFTMRVDSNNIIVRTLNDGIAITQRAFVDVAHGIRDFGQSTFDLFTTHEENQRLRAEMYRSELLRIENALMREQNDSFREMLGIDATLDDFEQIVATTIGRDIGSWHDFITVNQGSHHGVEVGMAVVSAEGFLIGRVTEVNLTTSRIHFMKPHNSTVQTQVEVLDIPDSYGRLIGYDADLGELVVTLVPYHIEIEIGARVITSGLGDIFPRGLLVGYVTRYERTTNGLTQNIYLSNEVQYDDMKFVFIIKRAMNGIDDDRLEFEDVEDEDGESEEEAD